MGELVNTNCTLHGKQWLTAALDPYHDRAMELVGMPDSNGGNSFVTCVKQSQTFVAPAGATNLWVLHVSTPGMTSYTTQVGNLRNIGLTGAPATYINVMQLYGAGPGEFPLGPVTVRSTISDENWVTPISGTGGEMSAFGETTNSPCRLIGMAFEIHDVTPKLYQQGTLTCYCVSASANESCRYDVVNAGGTITLESSEEPLWSCPPRSVAHAMVLPNTKQWEVSKGAYVVGRFMHFDPKPGTASGVIGSDIASSCCGYAMLRDSSSPNLGSITGPDLLKIQAAGNHNAFAHSGCILTGLNVPNGAITVNCRLIYEYFPFFLSDPYLSLATPSAPYDMCAFMEYSRIVSAMPPGVKVSDNASGDWFKAIARVVSKGVSFLPGLAGTIGRVVNSLLPAESSQPPVRQILAPRGAPPAQRQRPRRRRRVKTVVRSQRRRTRSRR